MLDNSTPAPANPIAFIVCSVRMLLARLVVHPIEGRAARKLRAAAAKLDSALCRALDVYPGEAALIALIPELKLRMRAVSQRAATAGVPLGAWMNALLPEPTVIELRLSPACLTLVGMAQLRACLEAGALIPRRVRQLKAAIAAEALLRQIVEIEAESHPVPAELVAAADAAAWVLEDEIGADLDQIFSEPHQAPFQAAAAA